MSIRVVEFYFQKQVKMQYMGVEVVAIRRVRREDREFFVFYSGQLRARAPFSRVMYTATHGELRDGFLTSGRKKFSDYTLGYSVRTVDAPD